MLVRHDPSLLVRLHIFDKVRVRDPPDLDERAGHVQLVFLPGLPVLVPQPLQHLVAEELLCIRVMDDLDVILFRDLLQRDRFAGEFVAVVDEVDRVRDVGQEQRALRARVPATDDRDILVRVQRPVADRTVGDATVLELLLARHVQAPRVGTGGDDDGLCGDRAVPGLHHEVVVLLRDAFHRLPFRINVLVVVLHVLLVPFGQALAGLVREPEVVLDLVCQQELAAEVLRHEQRVDAAPGRVHCGAAAARAAADDNELPVRVSGHGVYRGRHILKPGSGSGQRPQRHDDSAVQPCTENEQADITLCLL